ncbi:rubisco accumulation factor 1.1, chloroplastic-like [Vicia villosa]|uniref:rubisco accumulation factor 1.1, chloroplastic-like n=1 Tax=Vicia villosa TaxID=3911 RepID=UPI00273BA91B|nr:rubisco accumulation factor 1.1, chloroplastic-like [Vicia villosa]
MHSLLPSINLKFLNGNILTSPSSSSSSTNHRYLKPISAVANNSSSYRKQQQQLQQQPQQQLYQPFRPPPTPLPSRFSNLDIPGRIDILANRLGVWHEYAPLITSLMREGFSPPNIEETTGISGVEQNRIIVATQVRDTLVQSNVEEEYLSYFDNGGAEVLYEIRLLSSPQRASAARFLVEKRYDGKGAQDLARSIKDFPSRRGEKNWESFDYTLPGDCLAYMYYRQSKEHRNPSDERVLALEQSLSVVESEKARKVVFEELNGKGEGEEGEIEAIVLKVPVPVVRLQIGEVAEANSVVVLPVCRADEGVEVILSAPSEIRNEGVFGIAVAEKGWEKWVVLPGWGPVVDLGKGGVVVSFLDARVLPWKANRWYKEEPILVVADRNKRVVENDEGFYLVKDEGSDVGLKVQRGLILKESGVTECLGNVVLVVRPPNEDNDDQLSEEDWD